MRHLYLYPPVYGAYVEVFAGLSPEVTLGQTGAWSKFLPRYLLISDFVADNVKQLFLGEDSWIFGKTWLTRPRQRKRVGRV